jgi:hypothetical protein
MAETPAFQGTMQRFAAHFAGPPRVRVLKSAVTMTPESLRD